LSHKVTAFAICENGFLLRAIIQRLSSPLLNSACLLLANTLHDF